MEAVKQLIGRIEWIRRYSAGPFPEERNAYLAHLQKIGHSVRRMRDVNRFLLGIAEPIYWMWLKSDRQAKRGSPVIASLIPRPGPVSLR